MLRVPTRQRRACVSATLCTSTLSASSRPRPPPYISLLRQNTMESDMDAMLAQAAVGRGGGPDMSIPDKYVLSLVPLDPPFKCPRVQWRGHSYIVVGISHGRRTTHLTWRYELSAVNIDAEARSRGCTNGSHGSHARRIRGRVYRPSYRRLCYATIRHDRLRRVRRSRIPAKDGRHAQADWEVSVVCLHFTKSLGVNVLEGQRW